MKVELSVQQKRFFVWALFTAVLGFATYSYAQELEVVEEEKGAQNKTGAKEGAANEGEEAEGTEEAPAEEGEKEAQEEKSGEEGESAEAEEKPEKPAEEISATTLRSTTYYLGAGSINGANGVNRTISALPLETGSARFTMLGQWAYSSNFIVEGDKNQRMIGTLAFGITPISYLDVHAAFSTISNGNSEYDPTQLLNLGDTILGARLGYPFKPFISTGLDLSLDFNTRPGDSVPALGATAFVPTLLASFDGKGLNKSLPLRGHLNLGAYLISPSAYSRSGSAIYKGKEYPYDVSEEFEPVEQYGLDIIQSSQMIIKGAVEVPLAYATPYLEFHYMTSLGLTALSPGVRAFPFNNESLALNLAIDIGLLKYSDKSVKYAPLRNSYNTDQEYVDALMATTRRVDITEIDVRDVPATPPWNLLFGVSYSFDVRGSHVTPPPGGILLGTITSSDSGMPIEGAVISLSPGIETTYATSPKTGKFSTDRLPEGEYTMTVTQTDYNELTQKVEVKDGQAVPVTVTMEPRFKENMGRLFIRVMDGNKKPASVALTVRSASAKNGKPQVVQTDPELGSADLSLASGEYEISLKPDGTKEQVEKAVVEKKSTTILTFSTMGSSVQIENQNARLLWDRIEPKKPIAFNVDGITLASGQDEIFQNIVALIKENPTIKKIAVVAHTDDQGGAEELTIISEKRAQAVLERLASLGIARERLEARGMGPTQPIASNRTSFGRQMNNRVEFIVSETANPNEQKTAGGK